MTRRPRLLIVDDDVDIREVLGLLFEDDFEVTLAANGYEALDAAARTRFDAIILDLMMPGVDGFEVMQQLRARGITTPVVVVSAVPDLRKRARSLDIVASEPKPIDAARLRSAVDRAVGSGNAGPGTPSGGGSSHTRSDPPPKLARRRRLRPPSVAKSPMMTSTWTTSPGR